MDIRKAIVDGLAAHGTNRIQRLLVDWADWRLGMLERRGTLGNVVKATAAGDFICDDAPNDVTLVLHVRGMTTDQRWHNNHITKAETSYLFFTDVDDVDDAAMMAESHAEATATYGREPLTVYAA